MNKLIAFWQQTDQYFSIPLTLSLVVIFLLILSWGVFYQLLPDQLPLFYSQLWGEQQLASKQQFLILPASLLVITLINSFLAWQLHPAQKVLKRILLIAVVVLAILTLITGLKIIFLFV